MGITDQTDWYDSGTNSATYAINNVTWKYWTSMATASSTTNTAWYYWNDQATYAATATAAATYSNANFIWYQWNGDYYQQPVQPNAITPERAAEIAADQRQRAIEAEAKAVQARKDAEEAEARAEELLKASLTEPQRQEYAKDKSFTIISKDGNRTYRVKKGWSHNVERIDAEGKKIHTLCAHPQQPVPLADNQLAQKLMLEHDEDTFLKMANVGRLA